MTNFVRFPLLMLLLFSTAITFASEVDPGQATAVSTIDLTKTPLEIVSTTPKGGIINPFDPADPEIAKQGHEAFMETSCNGCHGGTGGGGMGPPLSNKRWVYGNDTDTLFRLVTLGTEKLQAAGYTRKARENVRAPMPPHASEPIIIESLTTERLLKIIAWVQSLHLDKK